MDGGQEVRHERQEQGRTQEREHSSLKLEKALLSAVRKDLPRVKVERKKSKRPLTMVALRAPDGRKLASYDVPLAGTRLKVFIRRDGGYLTTTITDVKTVAEAAKLILAQKEAKS